MQSSTSLEHRPQLLHTEYSSQLHTCRGWMRTVIRLNRSTLQLYRLNRNFPTLSDIVLPRWSCTRVSGNRVSLGRGRPASSGGRASGRVCFGPPEVYLSTGRRETRPPVRSVVIGRWSHCDACGSSVRMSGTPVWADKTDDNDDKVSMSERDCRWRRLAYDQERDRLLITYRRCRVKTPCRQIHQALLWRYTAV